MLILDLNNNTINIKYNDINLDDQLSLQKQSLLDVNGLKSIFLQ